MCAQCGCPLGTAVGDRGPHWHSTDQECIARLTAERDECKAALDHQTKLADSIAEEAGRFERERDEARAEHAHDHEAAGILNAENVRLASELEQAREDARTMLWLARDEIVWEARHSEDRDAALAAIARIDAYPKKGEEK